MKYLKKRSIAIFLTFVIAFVAMLFGVRKTAIRLTKEIEDLFYTGIYQKQLGFYQQSIDSQLNRIVAVSVSLATLMQNYPELESEAAAVLRARWNLLVAETIAEKHEAYINMRMPILELVEKATQSEVLSERELDAIIQYMQTLSGASYYIESTLAPAYTSIVDEYKKNQSVLADILNISRQGVTTPSYFRPLENGPLFAYN